MPDSFVTTERRDGLAVVTMDDGKANALSFSLIADLAAAISECEADETISAVVLAGREGRFSAGFDLSVMQAGDFATIISLVADGGDLVRQIYGASVPVVAACNGHALAAGALLLLGCDVRVGPRAPVKIGLNEVAIGMTLPAWALTIASTRLSPRHLQRAIANARLFDGEGAVDAGFLDVAVDPDAVLETAMAEAAALSSLNRAAYGRTMSGFRGPTLLAMEQEIAADRSSAAG